MHLRYKSLYISLPSSAKQQRKMTKGTWTTTAKFGFEGSRCISSLNTFVEPLAVFMLGTFMSSWTLKLSQDDLNV